MPGHAAHFCGALRIVGNRVSWTRNRRLLIARSLAGADRYRALMCGAGDWAELRRPPPQVAL